VRPRRRPERSVRRVGYAVGAVVNGVLLWLVHVWPGWEAVPFLTGDFSEVVGLVTLALWAGIATNLVYLVSDPRWLTALGGLVTTGIGLAAAVRLWQLFPFDLVDPWDLVVRVLLVVGIVGSVVALLVGVVTLVRSAAGGNSD
jgi:hypothetical protein